MIDRLQYITQGKTPEEHLENLQKACMSGIEWVQLRLKNFDDNVVLETAKRAREITNFYHVKLLINDHYKIAKLVKANGVHLGKLDACPLEARAYLENWQLIGGTANTLDECRALLVKGVSYIGLGPFRFTQTKANLSPLLGEEGYKTILKNITTTTPIIAIGGIQQHDIPTLMNTGIHGIAISREITLDFNKISIFKQILKQQED
ncbi:Thiamine-phosphate synthase [Tenacibaculum maritimum]|uniref:thiamine phosphate synthase n=1 Tax=Tenacibaculum maritimum TaxID=107401 RepID=UPI0012E3FF97|nr:thiamine phosphate synthase [Tenacibaculum maritimum]CAA0194976.1 Thiamine-phosphate synthase [Tenacibaculum maritimum]CAA0196960.1 Thiamine-phosphate synthase [Tenacibaculum maritimum]